MILDLGWGISTPSNVQAPKLIDHMQDTDRKTNSMSTSMAQDWGITSLDIGACLGDCSGPVARDFSVRPVLGADRRSLPRSVGQTTVAPLPTDSLIDIKFWCRLCCIVPVRLHIDTNANLHIALVPERLPACWGNTRWLCLHPDVLQYLSDVGTVRNEGDDSQLPATEEAQQREHLVDAGNQHRPQVVRRLLGWQRLDRLSLGWE